MELHQLADRPEIAGDQKLNPAYRRLTSLIARLTERDGPESLAVGINAEVDKVRTNLEREIIGLDREKRMEEVACWRDVARLRAELDEAAREFGRERAKESLLSYPATPYTPQP